MQSGREGICWGGTRRGGKPRVRDSKNTSVVVSPLAHSRLYSEELGIDVQRLCDNELFKWLIASLLFGAHVTPQIAKRGYLALKHNRLLTPQQITKAGETRIFTLLLQAGYVRAAKQKSRSIIRLVQKLCESFQGSLRRLHDSAEGPRQLETLLMQFPGVGPVTANIFLRELRPFWAKADPSPLARVDAYLKERAFNLDGVPRKSLTFARVEAGVVRQLTKPGELRKLRRRRKSQGYPGADPCRACSAN